MVLFKNRLEDRVMLLITLRPSFKIIGITLKSELITLKFLWKNPDRHIVNNFSEEPFFQLYFKNDIDKIVDFPLLNDNGYFLYYNNCLFGIIGAMDFIRAYHNTEPKIKKSSKYLISMIPVFNTITEFSNPIIVKIYLK